MISDGRLVVVVVCAGAVRLADRMLSAGDGERTVAVRMDTHGEIEATAVLDGPLRLHTHGPAFLAEAPSALRWPRRCPFSRAGLRFVGHADVNDLFVLEKRPGG